MHLSLFTTFCPPSIFWFAHPIFLTSLRQCIYLFTHIYFPLVQTCKKYWWEEETKILGRKRVVITVESIGVSQLLGWHVPGFPLKVYAYALYTYRTLPFSICWTDSKKQLHLIFSQTFFIKYMLVQACIVYVTLHCNKENDPNCRFIIH